ncbi:hypothetical protein NP233_g8688 [Leucocoprinus birnbaumii]|uniref:Uncharacterized protein n=1 Tax=Leucocoprinus birnbaumii TaxID=56174 RepID=A0AAD5VPA4_9AGAR|nr:hypothetical protein NP233_g8688 [Leucocoprinus birnbaumii]
MALTSAITMNTIPTVTSVAISDALPPSPNSADLGWVNVAIALAFILLNSAISGLLKIGVGTSLIISAIRCMVQLTLVALILEPVFAAENKWAVAGISFLLNLLGTVEIVVNKSKRQYQYMFPSVLIAMLGSTVPVAILGTRFSMAVDPFWTPIQFIPVVGMLCGSTVTGVTVSVNYLLKEFQENRDKIEVYLAYGASRIEACRPIAIEALRVALTPSINSMSVLGIIAIPGMMTGAILGGSSVQQAARLQMIIMFMISAATTLASILVTFSVICVLVDFDHRIRTDRISLKKTVFAKASESVKAGLSKVMECFTKGKGEMRVREREVMIPLLGR